MSDEFESKNVSRRRLAAEAASQEQQGETPAAKEAEAEAAAEAPVKKDEEPARKEAAPDTITVVSPRPFTILGPRDVPGRTDVVFRKGINRVPASLRDHWYLKAMGCEVEE